MAGNYPDVPSWRMAFDRDGTQGFWFTSGLSLIKQFSSGEMAAFNDENQSGFSYPNGNYYAIFIFPELRDLDGYFVSASTNNSMPMWVSSDTTNGVDGTWTQISAQVNRGDSDVAERTNITSSTALNVRGIRIGCNAAWTSLNTVHFYGEPVPGENPHRLALWHPTLDERVGPAYFDWGDTPRGSSADRTFRVKNLSPAQTASSIRVAMEALSDANPSVPGQHALSTDGSSFLAQVNIGDLAPGAISDQLTLRRSIATNAALSLWWFRVFAEAQSWA